MYILRVHGKVIDQFPKGFDDEFQYFGSFSTNRHLQNKSLDALSLKLPLKILGKTCMHIQGGPEKTERLRACRPTPCYNIIQCSLLK